MKLLGRVTAAILCCLMLNIASVSAQANWVGTYEYTEVGGRTGSGAAMVVTHVLKVFKKAGGLAATLESNGYQTSGNLNCTVKIDGEKLLLYFESYGPDNMFEMNGKGDLLLTLVRKPIRGKAAMLTYWGKFTPVVLSRARSGKVYFTRSK